MSKGIGITSWMQQKLRQVKFILAHFNPEQLITSIEAWRSHRSLKPLVQQKLNQLGFDFAHFTFEQFVSHVETLRNRQIIFIEWPMPVGYFGAWVSSLDQGVEYVFYNKNIPPLLQVHTKLHELGHIICGHHTLAVSRTEIKGLLQQGDMTFFFQKKGTPGSLQDEVEAETVAILIQKEVLRRDRIEKLTTTVSTDKDMIKFFESVGLP